MSLGDTAAKIGIHTIMKIDVEVIQVDVVEVVVLTLRMLVPEVMEMDLL